MGFSTKFTAAALAAITFWTVPASSTSGRQSADVDKMRAVLEQSVAEMNAEGRLALSGITGGMANNLWQTVSHPSDPRRLGCGWQSEFVLARLSGVAGWTWEQRYEYGIASPILLPHQWLTGHGPQGETVQVDPWEGITVVGGGK